MLKCICIEVCLKWKNTKIEYSFIFIILSSYFISISLHLCKCKFKVFKYLYKLNKLQFFVYELLYSFWSLKCSKSYECINLKKNLNVTFYTYIVIALFLSGKHIYHNTFDLWPSHNGMLMPIADVHLQLRLYHTRKFERSHGSE